MNQHPYLPDSSFDGGDLDCGNGLLLLIRKHIDPMQKGQLLEIRSRESSVCEDLPAWCRMTSNELVSTLELDDENRFLVCKGPFQSKSESTEPDLKSASFEPSVSVKSPGSDKPSRNAQLASPVHGRKTKRRSMPMTEQVVAVQIPDSLPAPGECKPIPPMAVMGIGSWPRPRWLIQAIHERMETRLSDDDFQRTADDAVRLVLQHQHDAKVQVVTDGEQRRDNYSSFVGGLLDNCQLIPLTDLLPYVDEPEKFAEEMKALDIPAMEVRHPAVFGALGRSKPLALHEYEFVSRLTDLPVKIALPGPYLLTRTMWMECISDRAYESREELSRDVVRVLREELFHLLNAGVSIVQFDEPVLTEVAFSKPAGGRTFMCGALGEKLPIKDELQFARSLYSELTRGVPLSRTAIHICRGNWSRDESVALSGPYTPLIGFLNELTIGNYFLEMCTPRAGELNEIAELPADRRVGIGVVDQKLDSIENATQIRKKVESAIRIFGESRLMLTPDCGFATFADNPIASADVATKKLAAISQVRREILGQ